MGSEMCIRDSLKTREDPPDANDLRMNVNKHVHSVLKRAYSKGEATGRVLHFGSLEPLHRDDEADKEVRD